jgi:phosphohistidine phosphatase SixA
MKRIPLLIIFMFPIVVCLLAWYCLYSPVTTVIFVRHAERLNDTDTTSISEAGIERARALAHALSSSGVNRIYVSEKIRTTQTIAPTAEAHIIVPIQIPANDIVRYVDSVKTHSGDVILICGHSDTVPKIIAKLGISPPPAIGRSEFDHLFVVTLFRSRAAMVSLKF